MSRGFEMNTRTKAVAAAIVCASVAAVALATGCAAQSPGGAEPTYDELIVQYANEYESSQVHKADEEGEDNSHANLRAQLETPAVRAGGVAIVREVDADDPDKADIPKFCLSCKTSLFNDMYEEEGMGVFGSGNVMTDEDFATLDGRYFDCYSCHSWEGGGLVLEPHMIYAQAETFPLAAEFLGSVSVKEAVCGQCHNYALGRDTAKGYTEDEAQNCDPWRYGTDPEGMYRYLVEIGGFSTDEATGIKMVQANHPQLEMFQGSIHQSMGLACSDCHMNPATDESGATYVSHDASSSVAEDDEAMASCLACHETQDGIETVEDMRSFLSTRQAQQAARQAEVEASLEGFYQAIANAVQDGTVDDATLQQAKDDYSFARFLVKGQQQNLNDPVDGAQIAHNPDQMRSMLERANALVEEGMDKVG